MSTYEVVVPEVYLCFYQVEARSEQEARQRVKEGQNIQLINQEPDYILDTPGGSQDWECEEV